MISEEVATGMLRARGLKCTPQRLAVLHSLIDSAHHLSVAEVHSRVQATYPGIGLATVYRTLELLADLKLIVRLHLEDGCHRYTTASSGHRHQLVCSGCGLVVEFAECSLASIAEDLASRTSFKIEGHWLQLLGKCQSCQEITSA